jgi:hypothetical protein
LEVEAGEEAGGETVSLQYYEDISQAAPEDVDESSRYI